MNNSASPVRAWACQALRGQTTHSDKALRRAVTLLIPALVLAWAVAPAGAQPVHETWWTNTLSQGGSWFQSSNWSDGVPTKSNDDSMAFIDNGGSAFIGGTLGGGGTVAQADFVIVGFQEALNNRLTISGGTTLNTGPGGIIGWHPGATGTVSIFNESIWNGIGIRIGRWGEGTLHLSSGTINASSGIIELAVEAGSKGTLRLGNPGPLPVHSVLNVNQVVGGAGDATLIFHRGNTFFTNTGFSGGNHVQITGSIAVQKDTGGTTTFIGANDYTGGTTVLGGILRADAAGAFPNNTPYVVNGGTLDLNGHALTMSSLSGTGGEVARGNASLTIDQSGDTSYGGAITGTGGQLTKQGTGILELTGTSNYAGITAVNGGDLWILVGGSLTTGGMGIGRQNNSTGTVVVAGIDSLLDAGTFLTIGDNPGSTGTLTIATGGTVRVDPGAKVTIGWHGAVGTLNLEPGGTLIVGGPDGLQKSATATASNFNFAGGMLRVSGSSLSTSLNVTLVSGRDTTVDVDNGMWASFTGNLSGLGALTKTGEGGMLLSGTNTWSGGTTIDRGILEGDMVGALPEDTAYTVNTGGTLVIPLHLYAQRFTISSLSGSGGTVNLAGGAGDKHLRINQSIDTTYAGQIIGAGVLEKLGDGTLTLTGASSSSGGTTVGDGTLIVNGSITNSTVTVHPAGTLGGSGTLADVVVAGGTLARGTAPGTLNITGSLSLDADAALEFELDDPAGPNELIAVTGDLVLDGTLNVTLSDGFSPQANHLFNLFTFGSLSGTFSTISLPGLPGALSWDTSSLYTDGILRVAAPLLPGDANRDGRVDGEDFLIWQASFGIQSGATWDDGDFNFDGRVDGEDFLIWQAHFGSVAGSMAATPEPAALAVPAIAAAGLMSRRRV